MRNGNVVKPRGPKPDAPWLRRLALQIAAQLPDDSEDAAAVIEYLRELQTDFIDRAPQAEAAPLSLVSCDSI